MDRKLFFSYIQNMQQNNPDMIGFQNSLRKNSWQKPRSICESIRSDLQDLAKKAYGEFLDNDGTGHPRDTFGEAESNDYLSQHPDWRNLSDSARDDIRRDFIAHLGDIHDSHMDSLIAQHGPDEDAEEARVHALHRQGRFMKEEEERGESVMDAARELVAAYEALQREQEEMKKRIAKEEAAGRGWPDNRPDHFKKKINEANLRRMPAFTYKNPIAMKQLERETRAKSVLGQLLRPDHPLNTDPANKDERESYIRTLADMGMILTGDPLFTNVVLNPPSHRQPGNYEIRGPSASDPTKTGPGTAHANVEDLRRYLKFAKNLY